MVGEPGEAVMVGTFGAELEPRVSRMTAVTAPAAPARTPILAHLEDHQLLRFSLPSPITRVTLFIEMVISPASLPLDADTLI